MLETMEWEESCDLEKLHCSTIVKPTKLVEETQTPTTTSPDNNNNNNNNRVPGVVASSKLYATQIFGNTNINEVTEGEVISSLQFSPEGSALAVGDRGGRITLYKREYGGYYAGKVDSFKPYIAFQSHEPEFDYLKSLEIEEKIIQIKWIPRTTQAQFLLASNDKTVKLWRVGENLSFLPSNENLVDTSNSTTKKSVVTSPLLLPPRVSRSSFPEIGASLRRSFSNGHAYHINSIAVNSDQETFLSSDDLRINLWNLEVSDQSFIIVDQKPPNMEELQEVITSVTFHPYHCNIFAYSTSKGATRLCDMRASATCDKHSKLFHVPEPLDPMDRGYFSEIVSSISDAQFSNSGRFIATRDYMTVNIWDVSMERKPVQTFSVHPYLETRFVTLYDNDCIFDKFTVSWNGSDTRLLTGSYHNMFSVMEQGTGIGSKTSLVQVAPDLPVSSKPVLLKPRRVLAGPKTGAKLKRNEVPIETIETDKKILISQWHPSEQMAAVASCNNLYVIHEKR